MKKPAATSTKKSRSSQSVRQHFAELEGRVRTIISVAGVCRTITAVMGGLMVCGLADWFLRLNDPGLRFLFAMGLAAGVGWTIHQWLWIPIFERRSNSFLASQLERRRPYIGSQLVSAAEFLEQKLDPRLGSPLLQQAVIDQAEHRLETIDVETVIDQRDVRNQALLAAAVCGLALFFVILWPRESATAVTRLLLPLSKTPWPRRVQLQIVEHDLMPWRTGTVVPRRVARGDTLELYVQNVNGPLPDDVQLEYRLGDDRLIREPLRKTILRDSQGHPIDVAGINLPVIRGPIQLRAIGGDDDGMTFFPIDVVLPPEISNLRIRLEPPEYTGRPAETLPEGTGDIHTLLGTKVLLSGRSSQPLSAANLVFIGGGRVPLARGEDQHALSAEFVLQNPTTSGYRFELTTTDGFDSGERSAQFTIRLTQDQVPQVVLDEPAADLTATSDAVLPLWTSVKDDYGVASLRLIFASERSSESQQLIVKDYLRPVTEDRVHHEWSLQPLNLQPGERLQFQMEVTDNFQSSGQSTPHIGRSVTRIVTIIGAEEKREELTNRLSELLTDLSQGIAVQRRVAEQTGSLPEQIRSEQELRPQDADLLRKLDLEQQRVWQQLLEPGQSVRAKADRLLEEFEANHLGNNDTTNRLENVSQILTELGREALPELQRRMTQAQKQAAAESPAAADQLAEELTALAQQQTETLRELEKLEAGLSGWQDRRHVSQQLSDIIDGQRTLNRQTRAAAEQQLQADQPKSSASDATSLPKLAQRQRSQAESIDQFRKQLAEMQSSREAQDPEMADRLKELSEELTESGIASELREAAGALANDRPGQAAQFQEEGLRKLEELENVFDQRPPDDQELLVKQMRKLEQDLETLHKAEEQLSQRFEAAAATDSDPAEPSEELQQLMKQQAQLADELADIERQLERLQLKQPRDAARRARQQMENMSRRKQSPAEQRESLAEALDDLEQARRELTEERAQAEEELAFEQMLRLNDELRGLAQRQTAIRDEVLRLDEQRIERGSLSRGQLKTLAQTAQHEQDLSQTVSALANRLSTTEVLALALRRLHLRLEQIADRLGQKQTDEPVQRVLQSVHDQFERLLAVLNPSDSPSSRPNPSEQLPPDAPQDPQSPGPPSDVITLIAQLELLKDLQADCAQRTTALEQVRSAAGQLTAEEAQELAALQSDQAELTALARNLLSKLMQPPPPTTAPNDGG